MNKMTLSLATLALSAGIAPAQAEVTDEQLQALEARIAQLESDSAKDAAAMEAERKNAERVRINGFMSAGASWIDDGDETYDAGSLSNEASWRADTTLGLQFSFRVNDRVNAVTQLRAEGREDFDPSVPWAYIGWQATPDDEVRIGRQRLPFYMLSEYLDVGYAYPWAKPPIEVYGTQTPSSYEGVSITHKLSLGNWSHEVQVYGGGTDFELTGADFETSNDLGFAWQASGGDWTLRGGYAYGNTDVSAPAIESAFGLSPLRNGLADFWGAGAQYDNGTLLAMTEYTSSTVKGYFPDSDSAYLTLGWRFGKFLPTVTLSRLWVTDSEKRTNPLLPLLCPGVTCFDDPPGSPGTGTIPFPADTLNKMLDAEQRALTVGVRYDFLPNASVKFDVTTVRDTGDTWGTTTPNDTNHNGTDMDELLFGKPDTPLRAYRLVVDVVF